MRTIDTHKVNPVNDTLRLAATDAQTFGANHRYVISGFDNTKNFSKFTTDEPTDSIVVLFQNGPIPEHGVNGVTHEVLLAIVKDRLECFQAGPFASEDNAKALDGINQAIEALHNRTRARMSRGVEGTHTP